MSNCVKLILPSATTLLARRIAQATRRGRHVFLKGGTMGGGPCGAAVRRHLAAGYRVSAEPAAARTFHDNLERVKAMGVEVVEGRPDIAPLVELKTGDVDLEALERALEPFELQLPPRVAVAVQDHGFSPDASNRAFRFKQWSDLLASGRGLESLLYSKPPEHLTRMRAVCESVPGARVMDTGAAAILGVLTDPWVAARQSEGLTIVNVGNEHTVAALLQGGRLWGIYEHHTSLLTPEKLADHLKRFAAGELTNQEIFEDRGHGCRTLEGVKAAGAFANLSLTGPNRERFQALGGHMAAPFGDMMLTGCFGLLEAIFREDSPQ